MKIHVGTNLGNRAYHLKMTDTPVHNAKVIHNLLHVEETLVYGDKTYVKGDKAAREKASGIDWRVNRKVKIDRKLALIKPLIARVIVPLQRLSICLGLSSICGDIVKSVTMDYIRMPVKLLP